MVRVVVTYFDKNDALLFWREITTTSFHTGALRILEEHPVPHVAARMTVESEDVE